MKKFFIYSFLLILLFISCSNNYKPAEDSTKNGTVSFDTTETIQKDELVFLSLSGDYKLTDEQINYDLTSFLSVKNGEIPESTDNELGFITKSLQENNKRFNLDKKTSFTKSFSNRNVIDDDNQIITKSDNKNTADDITFSIYDYLDSKTGKKGFALCSDDERVGSILCIIEDQEYSEDMNNPILDIFLSNLDTYVENVSNEWESITEVDYELFKEKYNLTDEDIEKARLEYENSLKIKEFWGWGKWSDWSINDVFLNNYTALTKWGQGNPYNSAIKAMYNRNYLVGCGAVAVAQIMAYHRWPCNYGLNLNDLKDRWFLAKRIDWDGVYNWDEMLRDPKAKNLFDDGLVGVGALLYEVAEGIKSDYSEEGTSSYIEDSVKFLRKYGYLCDNVTKYSFDGVCVSLMQNYPLLVRGDNGKSGSSYSGHAWVIDGAIELKRSRTYYAFWIPFPCHEFSGYVHCNYGWGGRDDEGNDFQYSICGYYKSGVFSTSIGDYNNDLQIVRYIRPNR